MIATLFPDSVVGFEATPEMWESRLRPEEEAFVRNAVPKRRREFAAGRACARRALASLGVYDVTLPAGADRSPLWPAGIVGSIAHAEERCAVVAAHRSEFLGLGLDIERVRTLAAEVARMVCGGDELEAVCRAAGLDRGTAATVVFSVKEATYKCCFPITRAFWDFHDVHAELDPKRGTWLAELPSARPVRRLCGRFAIRDGWILSGAALPA